MKRKFASFILCLICMMILTCTAEETVTPAPTETPTPTPLPSWVTPVPVWALPQEDGYPIIIDRLNKPSAYPDFQFAQDADLMEIWVANLRNADCTMICYQNQIWMIDCGDERAAPRITEMLKYLGVDHIDKLINSHPHHDHLNGLATVTQVAKIDELAICFPKDYNQHMINALQLCEQQGIQVTEYTDGSVMTLGKLTLETRQNMDEIYSDNNRSAITRLNFGKRSLLFTADIEYYGQMWVTETLDPAWLKTDILKYPHHGMKKLYEEFYLMVDPLMVLNFNNKVTGEAPKYLDYKHIPTAYATSRYVHMVTDGEHWFVERVDPERR